MKAKLEAKAAGFDSHRFVKRLKNAGMPEVQAEVLADERGLLLENLASKDDIAALRADSKASEARTADRFEALEARTAERFDASEARTADRFDASDARTADKIEASNALMSAKIEASEARLNGKFSVLHWMGATILGILIVAVVIPSVAGLLGG
ncbi:MAG: hypothetical protein GDA55_04825 [Cellvibrionales bacterium]|nr:hypothetical protein [Cellvibrionales bacterium]